MSDLKHPLIEQAYQYAEHYYAEANATIDLLDALAPFGITAIDMPLRAEKGWSLPIRPTEFVIN